MQTTTRQELEELQDTPLVLNPSEEPLNSASLETANPSENSKPLSHLGSGYNSCKGGGMSAEHNVFVLDIEGKPLTPTTNARARKLLKSRQAKPVWNKFGKFGIQMLVETRKETPETVLGIDFGTKFEGYAIVVGKENNIAVMWKLPDKKKIVTKLGERRLLRRARRFRSCGRRQCRSNNRGRENFIAPSQNMIIQSRLKVIREFFKYYPIDAVALEDIRFNHRDHRWGKNFSTVEIGKRKIYGWIRERAFLSLFFGSDTEVLRDKYGYKKSSSKNAEIFDSHCSDALAIATEISAREHIPQGDFIVVDDTYRCVRRRLHDTEPTKGGIREKYSSGNFRGIKKGTLCNFGQICGGIKEKMIRTYDWNNKRLSKPFNKLEWLSHKFKTNEAILQ